MQPSRGLGVVQVQSAPQLARFAPDIGLIWNDGTTLWDVMMSVRHSGSISLQHRSRPFRPLCLRWLCSKRVSAKLGFWRLVREKRKILVGCRSLTNPAVATITLFRFLNRYCNPLTTRAKVGNYPSRAPHFVDCDRPMQAARGKK